MATIDYKQKIKDYMNSSEVDTLYKSMLKNLFPELAESEDKRIRKAIINIIGNLDGGFQFEKYGILKKDALAWLEKEAKGNEREISSSEQKSADKVEPKFKVGDFLVSDYCIGKVVELTNDAYLLDTGQGIPFSCEHNAHLWTIQDAKDGDVLADNVGVILFRKIGNEKYADAVDYHCAVYKSGSFIIQKGLSYWGYSKDEQLCPATKEQRERFFATMHEVGYEWDAEKKELKRIEQKPVKRIDIDRAIDAFRRACPHSIELKHLDGTTEPYECFGSKCKEHSYRCNYICKSLRRFIDILKEPEQ